MQQCHTNEILDINASNLLELFDTLKIQKHQHNNTLPHQDSRARKEYSKCNTI